MEDTFVVEFQVQDRSGAIAVSFNIKTIKIVICICYLVEFYELYNLVEIQI